MKGTGWGSGALVDNLSEVDTPASFDGGRKGRGSGRGEGEHRGGEYGD